MKNKKSKNKLKNTCKLWKMLLSLHPVWSVYICDENKITPTDL